MSSQSAAADAEGAPAGFAAAAPPAPHRRVPALDGVRGLAIVLVLVYHCAKFPKHTELGVFLASLRSVCWGGVDLFFVLSGFLITGVLLDARGRANYYRNFYVRRVLRIFPLYYGVLAAVFVGIPVLLAVADWQPGPRWMVLWERLQDRQIWLWAYLQNFVQAEGPKALPSFGPFWSLAIEEQFYMVWPFVVALAPRRQLRWIILAGCLMGPLLRLGLILNGWSTWAVYHITPTRLDGLLFGAFAAVLVRDATPVPARTLRLAATLCVAAITGLMLTLGNFSTHWEAVSVSGYALLAILFTSGLLLLVQGQVGPRTRAVFESRTLTMFGKYSYAIYVFHWPIARWARHTFVTSDLGMAVRDYVVLVPLAVFLFVTVMVLLLAKLSWVLWESRWLRLKSRFS
ncbi:MAG: acyltransferase [Planctomycetota bacterium]